MRKFAEPGRIDAVDIVRGLIMIIMALDHTRDFFHINSITQNPTDLTSATTGVFLTRWITHLCAPTFVFLSGVSAFLSYQKKQDLKAARNFLFKRGLWLILLEFTVVNFGVWFDIQFQNILFEVIAAIGFGFIILACLLSLRPGTIGMIGVAIIVLHNLSPLLSLGPIAGGLFQPGAIPIGKSLFIMGYPIIPWAGIMLAGYGGGQYFLRSDQKRSTFFLQAGGVLLATFVVLRYMNVYGDPAPWKNMGGQLTTFLSFINVTKYAPSLLFVLLMLGIMFLLLALADKLTGSLQRFLMVYGKVPLFYFLIHWYILHPLLFLVLFAQGFSADQFKFGFNMGRPEVPSGLSLSWVYFIWLLVVIALYPLCRAYGRYKAAHPEKKWLKYV